MQVKVAQAESDKIELMRDLGSYESQAADNIGMNKSFTNFYSQVKSTVQKISQLDTNNDRFIDALTEKMQATAQYGDRHSIAIRQGEHFLKLQRGLRRMDHGGIDMEHMHLVHQHKWNQNHSKNEMIISLDTKYQKSVENTEYFQQVVSNH